MTVQSYPGYVVAENCDGRFRLTIPLRADPLEYQLVF